MKTILFDHVYVQSRSAVGNKMEAEGPLKDLYDKTYTDLYCGETTFEKAERVMLYDMSDALFRKIDLSMKDVSFMIGGDLMNQLSSSHYFARDFTSSFIGMYAACATSSLVIGEGAILVEFLKEKNVFCFTSSHNAAAEKQFRYPNEYGIQKKQTTTYTVTGAGGCILSNQKSHIKVKAFSIGEIVDWGFKDANDMGKAMAPSAYESIIKHLKNRNLSYLDYDLIVSGDLSSIGFSFFSDLLKKDGIDVDDRFNDCGLIVYDVNKQAVFAGGSGCACSMCVSMTSLLDKIETGFYKRIMVVATGALLSSTTTQQKESIPCVSHIIEYEWEK